MAYPSYFEGFIPLWLDLNGECDSFRSSQSKGYTKECLQWINTPYKISSTRLIQLERTHCWNLLSFRRRQSIHSFFPISLLLLPLWSDDIRSNLLTSSTFTLPLSLPLFLPLQIFHVFLSISNILYFVSIPHKFFIVTFLSILSIVYVYPLLIQSHFFPLWTSSANLFCASLLKVS